MNSVQPFLIRWLFTTIAVAVAAQLTGMTYDNLWSLAGAALLLGFVNAFVRPVLLLLGLPFIIVTLGLAILVINGLLLWMVGGIVPGFDAGGFWSAFFGAIIVSIVNWALSSFFKGSDGRYHVISHHGDLKPVQGRVIDTDAK